MKPAADVWAACGEDERWLTEPAAMVQEILREGFAAGVEAAARTVEILHDRMPQRAASRASGLASAIRQIDPERPPEPARVFARPDPSPPIRTRRTVQQDGSEHTEPIEAATD